MRKSVVIPMSIAALALGAGGIYAYYYYRKEINLLKDFRYKLIYFNIGDVNANITTCYVTIRLYNDSTLSAEILDLAVDCYVDGKKLGTLEKSDSAHVLKGTYNQPSTGKIIIPANGYSDAALKVTFSPKLVLGAALDILLRYVTLNDFDININGLVKIKAGFLTKTFPVDYYTTVKEILKT